MGFSVFFLVVIACSFLHSGKANLCKQSVIDGIKKIWGDNVPSGLIDSAKENGQEVVVATTANYYDKNAKCAYSFFYTDAQGDKVSITLVHKNGILTTRVIFVEEANGATFEPNSDVIRYHIIQNEGGVTAFYMCNKKGREGPPQGLIKVRSSCFEQSVVNKAKQTLKGLGINVVTNYPSICP